MMVSKSLVYWLTLYTSLVRAIPAPQAASTATAASVAPSASPSNAGALAAAGAAAAGAAGSGAGGSQTGETSDAWEQAQCTTPDITNAALPQDQRWNSVDTEDAWVAAVSSWTSNPSNSLSFPQQISNFFNGPEQMLCGQTSARDGCSSDVICNNVNHPGGMFILNSFVAISDLNYNIFDSIGNSETAITTLMGTFSTTFAPIADPDETLKLLVDLLGLGFALFASPVWNSFLKAVPFFKANGNTLGTLKDWVNPLVSNGITIAKDTGLSGAVIEVTNELNANLASIVKAWQTTVDVNNQQLFNGSIASIGMLHNEITQGIVLEAGFQQDDLLLQNSIEKAIYGYLIPKAWSLSNEGIGPVVIDSGAPCGTIDPQKKYISTAIGDATFICYNNKIYYLVGASGLVGDCQATGGLPQDLTQCPQNIAPSLLKLPGEDELDGTQWGGISKDDFIIGALNTYAANNNQNGGAEIDPTSEDALNDIFDNGIRAAGVIQIPVCSAQEAYTGWTAVMTGGNQVRSPHFPCK